METYGFIILRYVNSHITNKYWIHCYNCIRKFYPENKIMIVDDNSNPKYIKHFQLHNTTIINSEYKQRGEILPYYYYLKHKLFDRAVILHDSVFIQKYIDFGTENKFLWHFEHNWDNPDLEIELIKKLNHSNQLCLFYYKPHLWKGCFGVMSVISHDFLNVINKKYDFMKLVHVIKNRRTRMCLERIFALIFTIENNDKIDSIFGDIHKYSKQINYKTYINALKTEGDLSPYWPIIKVWTGR